MSAAAELLLPRPRRLTPLEGAFELGARAEIASTPGAERPAAAMGRWLGEMGVSLRPAGGEDARLRLRLDERSGGGGEAYTLRLTPAGAEITAAGAGGLFYGAATLAQWVRLAGTRTAAGRRVPAVEIVDSPSFACRGFLLDVSRNRVPRLAALMELVDLLAGLKINQLQLYTEHTFAYRGHEAVWRHASPLTPDEIRLLDAHCTERFVELVPNQNSFGHFHRWLVHEPYRRLAERPDGVRHAFGRSREPFSLCPIDPGSLELLEDLYAQLLPHFRSRQINVGLDETFDLGTGRSAAACAEHGKEEVYVAYLRRVHELVSRWGHSMQFWGDIILTRPDLIDRLPRDVVALDWGYEAGHPFASEARHFAEAGLDFYLCPGTSSWCSLGGRLRNAIGNLAAAAVAGEASGAAGYLITDWGDFGHLQPPPVSYPGIVAGAAFAWNASSAAAVADGAEPRLRELLAAHVPELRGEGLAEALLALGSIHEPTGVELKNSTVLFQLLLRAEESFAHPRFESLTEAGLAGAEEALTEVGRRLDSAPEGLVARELRWVAGMLGLACGVGRARLSAGRSAPLAAAPRTTRADLAARLARHAEELGELWLARSRPGGLEDSLAYLRRLDAALGID